MIYAGCVMRAEYIVPAAINDHPRNKKRAGLRPRAEMVRIVAFRELEPRGAA